MSALIELSGIERIFHLGDSEVHALRHLDLRIDSGEYVAIMGHSGSGKSTLLNLLGLLDHPDVGTYRLEGHDVTTLPLEEQARVRSERIGFVFQSFHLVPRLSAAENIALPMILAGIDPAQRRQRVERALKDYGLASRAEHRPNQLSGGQRQRVAIARATIMRPAMILADEPTGNLDRATGEDVMRLLEELNGNGVTLVVVTHDAALGARARRQLMIEDGRRRIAARFEGKNMNHGGHGEKLCSARNDALRTVSRIGRHSACATGCAPVCGKIQRKKTLSRFSPCPPCSPWLRPFHARP